MSFSEVKVPSSFISGAREISHIMVLYVNHLAQKKRKDIPLCLPYSTHVLVRAIETLFFGNFSCSTGVYVSAKSGEIKVGSFKKPDLGHMAQSHSWLVFKEDPRFILDIVPVYGVFGLTPVVPVCLLDNLFGYISSGDVDPRYWNKQQQKKMHEEVNALSDILQSFSMEVP